MLESKNNRPPGRGRNTIPPCIYRFSLHVPHLQRRCMYEVSSLIYAYNSMSAYVSCTQYPYNIVKGTHVFFGPILHRILDKNIFNTIHHKIIYDKRVVWMKDVSLLAIAFIIYAWRDVVTTCFVLFMRVIVTGVLAKWSNLEILLHIILS